MRKNLGITSSKRGITLLELAIVLGVMGLVMAAIWATASAVRTKQPVNDAIQAVFDIAGNVRGIYTGFLNATPPTSAGDQITAGFYPDNLVNQARTATMNPWGGDILVHFPAATPLHGFSIAFSLPDGMDKTARRETCALMVTRMPGSESGYAGGYESGLLPAVAIPLSVSQDGGPMLIFIQRNGAWVDVTGDAPTGLFPGTEDCNGFAVYYRF